MSSSCRILLFVLLFFSLTRSVNAVAANYYTGSISLNNNNNLSLGKYARDIISDNAVNLSFDLSHPINLSPKSRLVLSATASAETYNQYDGLNQNMIDLKAQYLFQFAHRFRSPQFAVYYLTGLSDFKSNLRDNTHSQYGLTISLQYDDRTLFRAGFNTEKIDSDSISFSGSTYNTFDADRESYFLSLNITATSKLSIYGSYSLIDGDITANWTTQTIDNYAATVFPNIRPAWETIPDTIFGDNRESTKYKAEISKISIGFNYAVNQTSAIDTVFESLDADSGIYSYTIERVSLSYLHRF